MNRWIFNMPKVQQSRSRIDWVRLVIPYPFKLVPKQQKVFKSVHNNDIPAGEPRPEAYKLIAKLLNLLALDKTNTTDLSLWTSSENGWPYDIRFARDGFDLRFNTLPNNFGKNSWNTPQSRFMPVTRLEMGLKLDIQGRGCRYVEHALSRDGHDWNWLFQTIKLQFPGATVRRLDLAFDFFHNSKHLTPVAINRLFEQTRQFNLSDGAKGKKRISSRRKRFELRQPKSLSGEILGQTFYLGKSSDDLMLRIYDKQLERIYSHGDTWRMNGKYKHYWYRWEVQAQGSVANKMFEQLANNVDAMELWVNAIRRMFMVLPSPLDKKRKHTVILQREVFDRLNGEKSTKPVEVPDWWADFIGNDVIDKYHLTTAVMRSDIESTDNWLNGPVAHSMIQRLISHFLMGGDPVKLLEHWLEQGNHQLNNDDTRSLKAQIAMLKDMDKKQLEEGSDTVNNWAETVENLYFDSRRLNENLGLIADRDFEEDEARMESYYERREHGYVPRDLDRYMNGFEGCKLFC